METWQQQIIKAIGDEKIKVIRPFGGLWLGLTLHPKTNPNPKIKVIRPCGGLDKQTLLYYRFT